jgi:Leucine-rich repeat (LRR) protein
MNDMVSTDFTMHDLVHDLTSVITVNEVRALDGTDPRTWHRTRYCRHAQLINYQNESKVFKDLPSKIRSLHFRDSGKLQLPRKIFSQSKYIRVLDLSGCLIQGQSTPSTIVLPSSIHRLKLLRYIDATGLPIASLPNSFYTLQNMQTLILSKCSLVTLPDNISSLHKLVYLDLSCSVSLDKLPTSLGKLSALSFLNLSGCSILQQLPESVCELTYLQHLDMSKCFALQELPRKFGSLFKLIFLNLSYCYKLTKLPSSISLESLEHLSLSGCNGLENLPKDFGNLQKLGLLNLSDCFKVQELPETFCDLMHLKHLDLSDCHGLKQLPKCFGNLEELESLNLASCPKLLALPESAGKMIKLKHLNLSYCIRLKRLPSSIGHLKLQTLNISACNSLSDLPDSLGEMATLTQLVVTSGHHMVLRKARDIQRHLNLAPRERHDIQETYGGCSNIVEVAPLSCCELQVGNLAHVRQPEDVDTVKLRDRTGLCLVSLYWDFEGPKLIGVKTSTVEGISVLERLIPPRTLEQFTLSGYMSKEFPNWLSRIWLFLPFLTYLRISHLGTCDHLPPIGRLPNLRFLHLVKIPNITKIGKEFYGEGSGCMKLRIIQLELMENLEEWWTTKSGEDNEESLIPNLHKLDLVNCPKLKFLPYPPRSIEWYLANSDDVVPERGFGRLRSSTLPDGMSIVNCNFSPEKWDGLQHFSTLDSLEVTSSSIPGALPDAIRCFISLRRLNMTSLKNLDTLPEWLGELTSLEFFGMRDCCNVCFLPESMKNLTALRTLSLQGCKGLNLLPQWLGQLTSLEKLFIKDCCSLLIYLPESMKNLTSLRELTLWGCDRVEKLPEWIGQLASLREFCIDRSPKVASLPGSIRNLSALMELQIWNCPRLIERCQGEDAYKITHVPTVILNGKRFRGGIGEHSVGLSCLVSTSRPPNNLVLDRFTHHDRS